MYRFGMGARSKFFWSIFLILKNHRGIPFKKFLGMFFDIKKS